MADLAAILSELLDKGKVTVERRRPEGFRGSIVQIDCGQARIEMATDDKSSAHVDARACDLADALRQMHDALTTKAEELPHG